MAPMTPDDKRRQLANLEEKGVAVVRRLIDAHAFPHETQMIAIEWVAQREAEADRARKASQAEIASRAAAAAERDAVAAERAATAAEAQARTAKHALRTAIAATAIAAAALIMSIVAILHIIR